MSIYCGNNRLYKKLLNGSMIIGDRYGCLKKGIGVGKNLPHDDDYTDMYEPIDNTKIYCGTNQILPENYDRMGTNSECHRIGVGVGKRIKAKSKKSRKKRRRKSRSKSKKRSKRKNKYYL
jgi:hypothetical protein